MAHEKVESPSPKSASSVSITKRFPFTRRANRTKQLKTKQLKKDISLEDQQHRNPPREIQSTDANESDPVGSSNGDYISDDKKSPTPTNNSPEPEQPSRSAKTLPGIEDNHHPVYSEGSVLSIEGMNDTIIDTIEGDPKKTTSACLDPTILERRRFSTSPTQRSQGLPVEDDNNSTSLPHTASSTAPSPIQPPNTSPSPPLLLAELPYLPPTPASSPTASPTPLTPNHVNFSPSPASSSSSYTSISEGDSDEEDWDDEMFNLWNEAHEQNPGPGVDILNLVLEAIVNPPGQGPATSVPEPGVTFVDDGEDEDEYSSQDDDSETESESESDSDTEQGQVLHTSIFASRYRQWPDFDASSDDERTTNYYSFSEESDDDAERELEVEGIRYPGINVFRLEGSTFTHDSWPEPGGDQQPEGTYLTDDEDEDEDDDAEWDVDSEYETEEAQWWGGDLWIVCVYCNPVCP